MFDPVLETQWPMNQSWALPSQGPSPVGKMDSFPDCDGSEQPGLQCRNSIYGSSDPVWGGVCQ